jgi:hypothetical protein
VRVAVRLKPGGDNCVSVDHERNRVSVRNSDGAVHSFTVDQVNSNISNNCPDHGFHYGLW